MMMEGSAVCLPYSCGQGWAVLTVMCRVGSARPASNPRRSISCKGEEIPNCTAEGKSLGLFLGFLNCLKAPNIEGE